MLAAFSLLVSGAVNVRAEEKKLSKKYEEPFSLLVSGAVNVRKE